LVWTTRGIPAALALVGGLLIVHWLVAARTPMRIMPRVALEETSQNSQTPAIDLHGFFKKGDGVAGEATTPWPGFRGATRDNIDSENVRLARSWPGDSAKKLWQIEVGEGYAGAAIWNGRVYLMDYDAEARADVLRCLSMTDGREIWRRGYSVDTGRNHGITRTVCAVADGKVVAIGPKCQVICADAISGEFLWGVDLARDWGTMVPPWYTGQNPLIDGGHVILAPGGKALLLALDLASGQVIWQCSNPNKWEMTHSSITPMLFRDRRLYLYCASGGLVGVDAASGQIVFELPQWKVSMANVPSPLPLPDDRVLLTGGYGAGAMMIQLQMAGSAITPKILLPPETFGAEQHTPIFYNDHFYGVIPGGQLVCLGLDGKPIWSSRAKYRFGLGSYLLADGMLLLMNDGGTLTLAEANDVEFKSMAEAKLFEHGHDAWGPLALSNGKLIARDLTRMACFDLSGGAQ